MAVPSMARRSIVARSASDWVSQNWGVLVTIILCVLLTSALGTFLVLRTNRRRQDTSLEGSLDCIHFDSSKNPFNHPLPPPPRRSVRPSIVNAIIQRVRQASTPGYQRTPFSAADYPTDLPLVKGRSASDTLSVVPERYSEKDVPPSPLGAIVDSLPLPPVVQGVDEEQGLSRSGSEKSITFRHSMFSKPAARADDADAQTTRVSVFVDPHDPMEFASPRMQDGFKEEVLRPKSHVTLNGVRTYEMD